MKKAYFEITNICNLDCSFCPKTKREKRFVSISEFKLVLGKLRGKIEFLYLHLMGEPTLHPHLEDMLRIASDMGFKVIITTNGTTLSEKGNILLSSDAVYKVSISVHSFEANDKNAEEKLYEYLDSCFVFAQKAALAGKICVFRLWNLDGENTVGENSRNPVILDQMRQVFADPWTETRSGMRLENKIFLEYGERFEWPDPEKADNIDSEEECFCHGLRDQIGILCDGSVVPCCLDSEGTLRLGNLYENELEDILSSPAATEFYNCFSKRKSPSSLCSNCGYAKRFVRSKK